MRRPGEMGEGIPGEGHGGRTGLSRPAKAAVLASGRFLTAVVNIVSLAVLSRCLTKGDYGTYRQAILAYMALAPFITLGLPQALYFFLPGVEKGARRILAENLSILLSTGALFSGFLLFGGNQLLARTFSNPALADALRRFWIYPLVAIPLTALPPCLMARDRPREVALFSVGSRTLILVLVVAAALYFRAPGPALVAMSLGTAFSFLLGLRLMTNACPGPPSLPTRRGIVDQLRFGIPLGLAGTVGMISGRVGQLIVSTLCTPEAFAEYANGAVELPMVGIITGSVIAVITPELAASLKRGRRREALRLWQNAMVKCATLLLPIMVSVFLLAPEFIRIVFSARYENSVLPFRLLLLILAVRTTNFGALFIAANRNHLVLIRSLVSLVVGTVLGVIFVKAVGAWGAALAVVVTTYGVAMPLNIIFLSRTLQISGWKFMPLNRLGRVFAVSLAAAFPAWLILGLVGERSDFVRLLVGGAVYVASLLVLFRAAGIREHVEVIQGILRRRSQPAAGPDGPLPPSGDSRSGSSVDLSYPSDD